eukprot:g247.t1
MILSRNSVDLVKTVHNRMKFKHVDRLRSNLKVNRDRTKSAPVHVQSSVFTKPLTSKKLQNGSDLDFNLCFSPGGFLIPYYLGVIYCLRRLGCLSTATPIAGTSAGALAAAFIVSEASFEDCMNITKTIQKQLLEEGYGRKVIDILRDFLPKDVHGKASGKIGIGLTVYSPGKSLSGQVLTQFESKSEFVDAVAASCYIPYYLGPKLGIEKEDGFIYSDGTLTNFFAEFPECSSSSRSQTITISALPKSNRVLFDRRAVDISPDLRQSSDIPSAWKILWNGLVPLALNEIDDYALKGYSDTLLWAEEALQLDRNGNLVDVIRWSLELGVRYISFYAFSIENFNRSSQEVEELMSLSEEKYKELLEKSALSDQYTVEIRVIGDLSLPRKSVQSAAARVMKRTQDGPPNQAVVNICFCYTSSQDICRAVDICRSQLLGGVDEGTLSQFLLTEDCPEVDLLVRTSGETRLSDFLLIQCRHSVIVFEKVLWPAFSLMNFASVIFKYSQCIRKNASKMPKELQIRNSHAGASTVSAEKPGAFSSPRPKEHDSSEEGDRMEFESYNQELPSSCSYKETQRYPADVLVAMLKEQKRSWLETSTKLD